MDPQTLFIRTCEDIEKRLSASDPYEILLIAGLIRKLLLDDHPLIDQVNRQAKLKLTFEVTTPLNRPEAGDTISLWSVQDGLDPETAFPGKPRQVLSRDRFLQETVAMVFGKVFSVREVILFEANVSGGVHAGAPRTDKERALHEVGTSLGIGGYPMALRQLLAIARVVLKGLAPLRAAVITS